MKQKIANHLKRQFKFYLLGAFVALNVFLVSQALLSSSESAEVSGLFSNFVSAFFHKIGPSQATIIDPESITISGPELLIIGQSKRLTTTIVPATTTDKSVYWTSSDSQTIEITTGGIAVAKQIGSAIIKAKTVNELIFDTLEITVIDFPKPSSFNVELKDDQIYVGLSTTLEIKDVEPASSNVNLITYISMDESIAQINEYGVIKGISAGTTQIKAQSDTFEKIVSITIIDNPNPIVLPTQMVINGPNSGYIYRSYPLEIDFVNTSPTDASVTWLSSNVNIAQVNREGVVYGYKFEGPVTITAISNADDQIIATHIMTFEKVYPTSVSLQASKTEIISGQSINITFTFDPADTYDRQLVWHTSDPTIAHISSKGELGLFTAIKKGTVTITAHSVMDESISASITLTVLKASTLNQQQEQSMAMFVRKGLGHFSLFFADAILGYFVFYFFLKNKSHGKITLYNAGLGLLLAPLIEALQAFAPGRSPLVSDGIINFLGYLSATLIIYIIFKINKYHVQRKAKKAAIND